MFFGILISQEEEESYVVAGATLCCSMGERTSQLQLPMSHGLYMNGKAQVNIKDREPNVNILPFGMCKLGGVCSPKIDMDWTDERSSKMVDGEPAVSNKSKLMCLYGGTIRIEDDGQEIGSGEKEESFWSELWGQAEAFFDGASDAAADDFTLGTLPNEKYTGFKDYSSKYPLSRKAGEVAGNLLGLVVGGAETVIGTGGAAIGRMASVTEGGKVVGAPLMRGSVAVAAHGVSMSTKAALGTGKSASEFWNMFANHNGTQGMDKPSGNVGTPPRYGNRQITDEEYKMLRDETPTPQIRKQVNKGHDKKAVTEDPVLPGKTFKGSLEADHIVPMDKITKMDGFGKLTEEQKLEVLNNPENFIGLSKSANTSKGSKSYEEWTHYKKDKPGQIEVDPDFRNKMIKKERELERKLQQQIDDLNRKNNR
ncbi:DUF4280 domain-containing protein [Aneurinibacillus aneurinilyticus]|jgi:hypothetical protein|uniref:DUF4280 domain-containing protein n=1 Tax=Aneurinibacillus aneurinilyticus TaxID=1391 RepID=UPI0023F7256C|nr:DUF4280 domain-containing protein [Aneurinibacillus aneurinilyticus]MCI1696866.1 DUF4280 domain-containing protein [Aneurinibacillus aneurinilyticus]